MIKQIENLTLLNINNNITVIKDRVAVESIQKYKNSYDETINIDYQFPIPSQAAVYCFEINICGQKYEAKIEEREKAIKKFEKESQEGNTAALLTKNENAFTFIISNIPADEEFEVILKYVFTTKASNDKYRLSIPTTLASKYGAERLTFLESTKEIARNLVDFNIKFFKVDSIKCSSDHDYEIVEKELYKEVILKDVIPNRDLTFEYEVKNSSYLIKTKKEFEKYEYLNLHIDEVEDEEFKSDGKNYVFLMDKSGSMWGQKFEKAKNMLKLCLRNLSNKDTFNIIFFNNYINKFDDKKCKAKDKEIERADEFIDIQETTGGTNIYMALKECIHQDNTEVLLFTDGQVYDTEEIYELVRHKGKDTRLFCFGIDDAIDEGFINKLASIGNGRSEFLNTDEDVYEKTINQMINTLYPIKRVVIKSDDETIYPIVYPGDNLSYIKHCSITTVEDELYNLLEIETIEDNSLYELLRIYYYYDLLRNKKIDSELAVKYSKESNIICKHTTFILVKQNDKKLIAKKNVEISGMDPKGWNMGCLGSISDNSVFRMRNMMTSYNTVDPSCFTNSVSCKSSTSSKSEPKMFKSSNSFGKQTERYKTCETKKLFEDVATEDDCDELFEDITMEIDVEKKDKEELLNLFLKQKTDGSIDGNVDKTIKAVKLYEKLGKPKTYKVQYKKAVKFLKNKKVKW